MRKLLVNSKSWVSPRYFEKGRDLSGESLVLLYFLFVSIYTYMLYFQFSLDEKKSRVGRNAGSKRDDITYTSRHTRQIPFLGPSPTHPLEGRVGQDPGN